MADPPPQPPLLLTVACPVCHERMRVELAEVPQTIACTFCESRVPVPSLEAARRELAAKGPLPVPIVEEYAIAETVGAARVKPPSRLSRPEALPEESAGGGTISLECATCHELIKARVEAIPGQAPCPFCGAMIRVPDRTTVAGWQVRKIDSRQQQEVGEYAAGALVATPPLRLGNLFDKLAEVRREVAPPPPRWTFFSGVFTFPWRNDVHLRWIYMTVGFTAIAIIGLVLKGLAASLSGIGGGVAIAMFTLPIIWISMLTFSYSAACCLCILEATAAGLDRVEGWPDPQWKEWMGQMIYVGWVGAIPLAASYGVARLAGLAGAPVGWVFAGSFFVLYPIALLSVLEANSIWVPLTIPIVISLFRWWWAWLMFYFLAAVLAGCLGAIFLYAASSSQDLLQLLLGPLVAAAALIYFRLLGRLAWRMTTKVR